MDINTVVTLIGSVGFPIIACCAMAYFIATSFKEFNSLIERNNVLSEELIALMSTVNSSISEDDK